MTHGDADTDGSAGDARAGPGARLHVLLAAAVGALAAQFTHGGFVAVLLTGLPGAAVLVVVTVLTGGALAACGVVASGLRRSAWLGATALLVVPAVLVVDVVGFVRAGPSGSPDGRLAASPVLRATGAAIAAGGALLVRPARAGRSARRRGLSGREDSSS